jgi:hypothetical protein
VAVKVTGFPLTSDAAMPAVSVLAPTVGPRFQRPTLALPSTPVTGLAPVIEPPPDVTVKVTSTPASGVPPASRTTTVGAVATAVPAVAVCP